MPDEASLALYRIDSCRAAGNRAITFSAIGTVEGSFRFLPWFWGVGANLRNLSSPQAVAIVPVEEGLRRAGHIRLADEIGRESGNRARYWDSPRTSTRSPEQGDATAPIPGPPAAT